MMKHICLPILCAACAFVSCVSRRVAEQTVVQRDSLEAVVRAKDSLIEVVFADINAVTENLARIRTRENLVALARNDEGVRRPIEEIDADIAAIDRLLQENRQKIAALQRSSAQLRKADLRIEGLEKMIRDLDAQLTAKEGEIGRLRGELSQMEARMETLAEEAAARSTEVKHLSGEKAQLEDRLNTVYYIVGAEKALRDSGDRLEAGVHRAHAHGGRYRRPRSVHPGRRPHADGDPRRAEEGDRRHAASRRFVRTDYECRQGGV